MSTASEIPDPVWVSARDTAWSLSLALQAKRVSNLHSIYFTWKCCPYQGTSKCFYTNESMLIIIPALRCVGDILSLFLYTYPISTVPELSFCMPGTAWCKSWTLQAKEVSNSWVIYFAVNVLSITRCKVNVLYQSIHARRFCGKMRGCRLQCFYYIYLPDVNRDFTSRYCLYSLNHRNCLVFIAKTASKVSQQSMSHIFCFQCFVHNKVQSKYFMSKHTCTYILLLDASVSSALFLLYLSTRCQQRLRYPILYLFLPSPELPGVYQDHCRQSKSAIHESYILFAMFCPLLEAFFFRIKIQLNVSQANEYTHTHIFCWTMCKCYLITVQLHTYIN